MITRRGFLTRLGLVGGIVALPQIVVADTPRAGTVLERINQYIRQYHPTDFEGRKGPWHFGFTGFKPCLDSPILTGQYIAARKGGPYYAVVVPVNKARIVEYQPGDTFDIRPGLHKSTLFGMSEQEQKQYCLQLVDEAYALLRRRL